MWRIAVLAGRFPLRLRSWCTVSLATPAEHWCVLGHDGIQFGVEQLKFLVQHLVAACVQCV
jgi:hypothetical protein